MHIVRSLKLCSPPGFLAALIAASAVVLPATAAAVKKPLVATATETALPIKPQAAVLQNKTEGSQGELIGSEVDCNGDGISNESQIDFDGDGVSDECVRGVGEIPEPPFQQSYTPTDEEFYSRLPAVGWSAQYQCGEELYEVQLSRLSADQMTYSAQGLTAQGLTLTSDIVYDDLDPNLNAPLIIEEPESGVRYSFTQQQGDEFYEYAITNYEGDIGLYIYQTGEQILAAPCTVAAPSDLPVN
ncbi:MAG: hypothetical protein WA949_07660 [Phormidesmis sp.]